MLGTKKELKIHNNQNQMINQNLKHQDTERARVVDITYRNKNMKSMTKNKRDRK